MIFASIPRHTAPNTADPASVIKSTTCTGGTNGASGGCGCSSGGIGGGKVSFLWYRTNLTIPAKIGNFDPTGAKVVITVFVDDYAEVWVNGEMPRRAGVTSPATIQGFNMPNRLVLGDNIVHPGDKFEVAVFAINGPISAAPANFLWFREAKIEFYR